MDAINKENDCVYSVMNINNQSFFQPYRLVTDANSCILCGRSRGRMANPRDRCKCESMTFCNACTEDDK